MAKTWRTPSWKQRVVFTKTYRMEGLNFKIKNKSFLSLDLNAADTGVQSKQHHGHNRNGVHQPSAGAGSEAKKCAC